MDRGHLGRDVSRWWDGEEGEGGRGAGIRRAVVKGGDVEVERVDGCG